MKICALSDTHGCQPATEAHDLTIYAGDWTGARTLEKALGQTTSFLDWLSSLSTKQILVAGNHDIVPADQPALFKHMLKDYPSITYLQDQAVTIDGLTFYGTPYTSIFYDWWFMANTTQLEAIYNQIPTTTDVLITHGPAYGIRDYTISEVRAGSQELADRIAELPNLKHHIFGHIHEGYGTEQTTKYTAHNVSIIDEKYRKVHLPTYINI